MTSPRHIAIIMDGNGRWAKERGLPRLKGHERGAANVRPITEECVAQGVEFLTLYAFSTENWKRPDEEVNGLWLLLGHFLELELPTMMKNGIRLRTIGRTHELPEEAQQKLASTIAATAENKALTPEPDLLIRTSGGMRLSNFMLWQLSYAEFYITQKFWPDFGKEDLRAAVAEFHKRERRFGGI